jgi:hypothetical protein
MQYYAETPPPPEIWSTWNSPKREALVAALGDRAFSHSRLAPVACLASAGCHDSGECHRRCACGAHAVPTSV